MQTATRPDDLDLQVTVGAVRIETAMTTGADACKEPTDTDLNIQVKVGAARVETAMMQSQVSPPV